MLYKYWKNIVKDSRQVGNILQQIHTLFIKIFPKLIELG